MTTPHCGHCRELAPELALGLVTGPERAEALLHLQGCAGCRDHLAELARLHDSLLALIPGAEPPAGFETRVLARLDTRQVRPARRRVALTAAAVLAAAVFGGAVVAGVSDRGPEPVPAAQPAPPASPDAGERTVMYAPLTAGDREIGQVYAYRGSQSWMYVYLEANTSPGPLTCVLQLEDGSTTAPTSFPVTGGDAFWGGPVPLGRSGLAGVRVSDATGTLLATARFDAVH